MTNEDAPRTVGPAGATESLAEHGYRTVYRDERLARDYDHLRFRSSAARRRRDEQTQQAVRTALGRLTGVKSLLDLPCGTGRMTSLVRQAGLRYTGGDLSPEMIEVARAKFPADDPPDFRVVDAEAMPFSDGQFECILSVRFLNLMPHETRLKILREMHRVSARYLVVAAANRRPPRAWRPHVFFWYRKELERHTKDEQFQDEIRATGWEEDFWLEYKSRGFFSTTRGIGVFRKRAPEANLEPDVP